MCTQRSDKMHAMAQKCHGNVYFMHKHLHGVHNLCTFALLNHDVTIKKTVV